MSGSERLASGQRGCSRRGSTASSGGTSDSPGDEPGSVSAGSYWQDPLAIDMSRRAVPAPRVRRALRAVYVINETVNPQSPDSLALKCFREACEDAHAVLETVPFGRLVLGETGTLDCFYNADVAVVEMTDPYCQPSLFYHLGVRESFSMTNNVVLCCDSNLTSLQSLQDIICQRNMGCYGNYIFIPYIVTTSGKVFCCEASMMKCLTEMFQPHFNLEPLLMPLVDRLTKLLEETQINSCEYFRESIRNEIRKAREMYSGKELREALARIQQQLDSVELLSADIVMNLLLSYRDVQDLNATIKLVETLQKLPTCNVAELPNIKFHYCFALNRRNQPGDRERALSVILPVVETGKQISSDLYCLCGRIYKDIFISSDFTDYESRDKSCYWYGMAFEHEPTLHSGINVAVFLMAAGHKFDTSPELRKIGMKLSSLLGRKGSLEKMQFYWDVGFFLGASILFNDRTKIIQASEKLYRLNAPVWYLASAMETYLLYRRFKMDTSEQPLAKQDLVDFWMEFLLSICRDKAPTDKFLVLILEPTKVFQPTHLTVSSSDKDKAVSMWHVSPAEENGIHTWIFSVTSIRGVSVSKCNERCCFLYVLHNFDDFQLYFPTELHCKRSCPVLNSFTEESQLNADDALRVREELLEYKYEYTENGERLILGKGTYGIVYAGRDMNNQVRIAIKEIPERDNRYSQPLHEEIALHKHLKHRNIVQYLGSVSQDGYIKIFMEEVPGGEILLSKMNSLGYCTRVNGRMACGAFIMHGGTRHSWCHIWVLYKIVERSLSQRLHCHFTWHCFECPLPLSSCSYLYTGEFHHSLSVPALGHLKEGGESRQPLEFKLNGPFLSRSCSIPGPSAKSSSPKQEFLSVLEEQVDDFSAPSSPEENAGLFLLKKDSERRDALFKILTENCETVVQTILEAQAQNSDSKLTSEHIRQLVTCLTEYIRTSDHKLIVKVLSNLQTELHFDKGGLNEIQIVIFSFQDAVIKLLRRNQIKPHWMFALDNIICKAMQIALSILIPESKPQSQGSFDEEADEHGTDNIPGKWSGSESDVREREALELQMDGAGTSGVSTLSRSMSHDSQQYACPLIVQLSRLRAESNRLLEDLAEKEREFQQLLQLTIHQKDHSLKSLRKRSESSDVYSGFQSAPVDSETEELTQWLLTAQVDKQTIDKIVANGYTLQDLLTDATRDDLKYSRIRGGMLCRLWAAISAHRKTKGKI
ncbi:mitogen-activated protein kinase kinase kinase 5-like [Rhincodon typus]|uniref:mitogen-activated protein kinase kinase kinase 5-like n=1 Tax=Rhincodon typus TaxID=259920 RepID=UPI00203017CD|nr:mitogen-activated protein kinase kinase kinase 5-like [Rhincodon typus]